MRSISLADGRSVPVVGQGTWDVGARAAAADDEVAALRLGLDLGMTLIDTAEMYADGGAESIVARAIEGRRRDELFLVSKVLPSNASRRGTLAACERSLKRLRTDFLDLYLLHWHEDDHPLEETFAAFDELQRSGRIRRFGVSNFDDGLMQRAVAIAGRGRVACNQVLYNLARRGIEWSLLPSLVHEPVLVMAYSPFDQNLAKLEGRPAARTALERVAQRHGVSTATVALAWTIRGPGVVTIPKSATPRHVRENAAAAELALTSQDLAELDAAFPPPSGPSELETV
jgi:diketogulonate reductase-like aldo/keto reductase